MLGLILRLFFAVMILTGVVVLFAFSFVAALIVTPIILLLIYLFGRRSGIQVWTVSQGGYTRRDGSTRQGPVIDHDPNDLPENKSGPRDGSE